MTLPTRLRVLVATPLGRGGMGGIDRIMDEVDNRLSAAPKPDLDVRFMTTRGQGHIGISPFLVARFIARLAGRLAGQGPDVLHINLSSQGSTLRKIAIARAARAFGIPYVIHLHGSGFRPYWDRASPALSGQIRAMFAHAARTLVLGQVWQDYIGGKVPEIADRLVILPNATPAPPDLPHERSEGQATILFLGHVGPRKGVPQLVQALAAIVDQPGWRAIIAGNGEVEETKARLALLGLQERVSMPGWVGPDDVMALLRKADILALPSFEENLPMSVIEGMANGLAVVATPVGATEDIIHDGETGLLVPAGDADALAAALRKLVADRELRERLGASAQAFHRAHLAIDGYVDHLAAIWRSVALDR